MTPEEVSAFYDECLEKYSHECEYQIGNDTITFFRRSSYRDFDDSEDSENFEDVEGDEALIAFVNKEAVFGWYEAIAGEDMKYALEDTLSYIFQNKNTTLTLHVDHSFDLYDFSSEDDEAIKNKIYQDIMDDFSVEKDQITDFTLTKDEDFVNVSFNVVLKDPKDILYYVENKEIPNSYSSFECSIDESDENKDIFEDLFDFDVDFLY